MKARLLTVEEVKDDIEYVYLAFDPTPDHFYSSSQIGFVDELAGDYQELLLHQKIPSSVGRCKILDCYLPSHAKVFSLLDKIRTDSPEKVAVIYERNFYIIDELEEDEWKTLKDSLCTPYPSSRRSRSDEISIKWMETFIDFIYTKFTLRSNPNKHDSYTPPHLRNSPLRSSDRSSIVASDVLEILFGTLEQLAAHLVSSNPDIRSLAERKQFLINKKSN